MTIFILLLFVVIFNFIIGDSRFEIFVNQHLFLQKPLKICNIYRFDFREGEDFSIWSYSDDNFKKIVSSKKFKSIDKKDKKIVVDAMRKYYDRLDEKELDLYNKNCDCDKLINFKNYYYLYEKANSDTFMIIIADSVFRKLYIFNSVW